MNSTERTFRLPVIPGPPPGPGFPLVAAVAPLAVSALIFAVTGSAYVLAFAALGPVIAVATVLDGRRAARRAARREWRTAQHAHDALRVAVTEHLARLRQEAWDASPDAESILSGRAGHRRWAPASSEGRMPVVLGSGSIHSGIRIEGGAVGGTASGTASGTDGAVRDGSRARDARAAEEELRRLASELTDVPLVVDLAGGIGIVGPRSLVRAVARGMLVQVAHLNAPGRVVFRAPDQPGWEWLRRLPHAAARSPSVLVTVCEPGHTHDESCLLALAEHAEQLPPGCACVLQLTGTAGATIVRAPDHASGTRVQPELVSAADAKRFALSLHAAARAAGLSGRERTVPLRVRASELWHDGVRGSAPGATSTLLCTVGRGADGPVSIDLVAAGPHAVIGGTTGSGKSELLVTWVTSLAVRYAPEQVTFLLVDFKGGSAFHALRGLPHCVGLVTDLDEAQAARALASLRAEIRHRERVLQGLGARDVADARAAGCLPRLVIVVDEFQAMLGTFDDLHVLFTDLAARGRSLGIHLILCTQRPAGVVRDALLANCNLRLSLRVNNRADSVAVIGAPDAADLSAAEPGRCLIAVGGDGLAVCQVAVTEEQDIAHAASWSSHSSPPRRPWLDPLPGVVTMADLAAVTGEVHIATGTRILGLLDEPEEQRYRPAVYQPAIDGHLLVVGGAGAGKTGLVTTLAAQGHGEDWLVQASVEAVWDALAAAAATLDQPVLPERDGAGAPHPLLLLDDFDAVFGRWPPDYQSAALDRLAVLLRQGEGIGLVITAQRLGGPLAHLATLCPATLQLGVPSREAHRAAGGDPSHYDPRLPAGGGRWQGSRVQLLMPPDSRDQSEHGTGTSTAAVDPIPAARPVLVVSGAPARTAADLRARRGDAAVVELAGGRSRSLELQELGAGTALVADADAWQSHIALLTALRPRTDIVFDRCTLGDYRLISRRRDLPPALAPQSGRVWLLRPDGDVRRAVWD